MLISTLVSVILLTGLVLVVQSLALSSAKVLKRLVQEQERAMAQQAARALARPLIADAMIRFDEPHSLQLNSTPYAIEFEGYSISITAQDVNGLVDIYRTPDAQARALLPADLYAVKQRLPEVLTPGQPFAQSFVLAGGDLANYPRPENWLTLRAKGRWLNGNTLSARYKTPPPDTLPMREAQPNLILIAAR